jgi:DNA-binding YbaB/EbfC family protein
MFDQMKNLKDLAGLFGNREQLQQQMQQMQDELQRKTVEADAGGGAVRVTCNGKLEIQSVQIDRTMLATLTSEGDDTDKEMVEELITAATNAAIQKAQQLAQDEMASLASGMNIPGLDKLMGGMGTTDTDTSDTSNTGSNSNT